jgi:hypothetical protein
MGLGLLCSRVGSAHGDNAAPSFAYQGILRFGTAPSAFADELANDAILSFEMVAHFEFF